MPGFEIRNPAQRIQNPVNDWNPESRTWNPEYTVEFRIQDCLGFPYMIRLGSYSIGNDF